MAVVSLRSLVLVAPLLRRQSAVAADVVATPSKSDALAPARARIAEKNWPAAIDELKKVKRRRAPTGTT